MPQIPRRVWPDFARLGAILWACSSFFFLLRASLKLWLGIKKHICTVLVPTGSAAPRAPGRGHVEVRERKVGGERLAILLRGGRRTKSQDGGEGAAGKKNQYSKVFTIVGRKSQLRCD